MTSTDIQASKGRAIVASIISSYYTLGFIILVFRGHHINSAAEVGRAIFQQSVTALIFYALWRGYAWARWLFFACCGLSAFYIFFVMIPDTNWRMLLFLAYPIALAVTVAFPEGVDVFLRQQAAARKEPNQSPEPTALSVTIRACARLAPASTVAHL